MTVTGHVTLPGLTASLGGSAVAVDSQARTFIGVVALHPGALSGAANLSVTPLGSHGLPGLLPAGWSAVSAWWLDLGGAALAAASPALPSGAAFTWATWDPVQHAWVVLATPLAASALSALALPAAGGYALLLPDPGATAPPAPVAGAVLPGFAGTAWVAGLAASDSITPALLPTAAAINGAQATASFSLAFGGQTPIPSATLIQADVLQSYTLVDQSVIEPDGFTQDLVASQWLLEAPGGTPVLTGVAGGLGLHLPVRMSRTFSADQLVQGRILVGFYHDWGRTCLAIGPPAPIVRTQVRSGRYPQS
jgi:hypothetical protein